MMKKRTRPAFRRSSLFLALAAALAPVLFHNAHLHTDSHLQDAMWVLLVVPVAILAYEWGLAGGILAGLLAGALVWITEGREAPTASGLTIPHAALRLVVTPLIAGLGLAMGLLVARLRRERDQYQEQAAELQDRLHRDPVTGLANRAAFDTALRALLGAAQRGDRDVGLIMLDLDSFKQCNDTCGHLAGDLVLRMVSDAIARSVRSGDLACRYGGDEFAVILPGAGEQTSRAIADRIVENMQGIQCPHAGERKCHPSVSAGAAVYPARARTADQLIAYADADMYRAKPH